jgi:hypothetical protein
MKNLDFTIFGDDLQGGDAQAEAQDAIKAAHKYQRKIAGLEIKRTGKTAPDATTPAATGTTTKPATASKAAKKPAAAKKPKQDDARKAFITLLALFDKKTEVDLAIALKARILGKYKVAKLTELQPDQFAAFIVDCETYTRDDEDNEFNKDVEDDDEDDMSALVD